MLTASLMIIACIVPVAVALGYALAGLTGVACAVAILIALAVFFIVAGAEMEDEAGHVERKRKVA